MTSGDPDGALADEAIGVRIRDERHRRRLTLAELAARSGLTVNALSQIERGSSEPSLGSVRRIAEAFGLEPFQLLLPTRRPELVIRRDQRPVERASYPFAEFRRVSASGALEFDVTSLTIRPDGAAPPTKAGAHAQQECAVLLSGRVRIEVADYPYDLEPGDSLTIDRDLPHRYVNIGEDVAELLIVSGTSRR